MTVTEGAAPTAQFENIQVNGGRRQRERTLLADPPETPIDHHVISVDDHVLETPDLFEGRLPAKFASEAPRIVRGPEGGDFWLIEGVPDGMGDWNVAAGRPMSQWSIEPLQYDEVRRGGWDPRARLIDMDLTGMIASVCFPSGIWGFAGQRFMRMKDRDLGFACVQAYNDWVREVWSARGLLSPPGKVKLRVFLSAP